MTNRRYREDEVRKIFSLAADQSVSRPPVTSPANGLSLAEIQSIGHDVGLDPEAIARAATALDISQQPVRTSMGVPIEVTRTVQLPRAPTQNEWEQLVAELRTTFRATGKISTHGELREWRNGNLYASVEPTAEGYRLRMGSVKGDAAGINALGVTGIAASAVTFASLSFWGVPASFGDAALFLGPLMLGGGGIAALLGNRARVPRWARQRAEQMEQIGRKLLAIMDAKPLP
jgi:hypothetical protein